MHSLLILGLTSAVLLDPAQEPIATTWDDDRLLSLANDESRIGRDRAHGGAITFLTAVGNEVPPRLRGRNFVNSFDLGRQIQMSHYAPPNPFEPPGVTIFPHWKRLGWNAVQAGDHYGNGSPVLESRRTDAELLVRSRPMQWPMENVASEAIFEMRVRLNGPIVRVDCTTAMERTDEFTPRPTPHEVPAVYVISEFHRVVAPLAEGISDITQPTPNKWTQWKADRPWAVLANEDGFGVGVLSPDAERFTGGLHGQPGVLDVASTSTTYVAPVKRAVLPKQGQFDYTFYLTIGTISEISRRFDAVLEDH